MIEIGKWGNVKHHAAGFENAQHVLSSQPGLGHMFHHRDRKNRIVRVIRDVISARDIADFHVIAPFNRKQR